MAKVWVQLTQGKSVEIQGKQRRFVAGDWVEVGKQTALLWISEGAAWVPEGRAVDLSGDDCGVFILGNLERGKEQLGDYVGKIALQHGDTPTLPWPKTLIYNPSQRLRKELVPVGFHLLNTWQVALPLWDYAELAIGSGGAEDRARTQAIIKDLRVPLYSPDLVFVRRSGDTTPSSLTFNS